MRKEGEHNSEDMRALFKMLQNDGRVHIADVDKLSKKIDKISEETGKYFDYFLRTQRWSANTER